MHSSPLLCPDSGSVNLRQLWGELITGRVALARVRHDGARCYALLEPGSECCLLSSTSIQLLTRVLLGESQKVLAFERRSASATIATHCARAMSLLAPDQDVSRAPMLLVMAAHAAHGLPLTDARRERVPAEDDGVWVSCELPVASLQHQLSRCEFEVARLAIEGKRHTEIANIRQTSVRTIANQLASIFTKLRISGRAQLRCKVIVDSLATQPPLGMTG